DARALRAKVDAIIVGVETVLADDPRLTARARGATDPVRVVLDSALRTPVRAKVLPAIIATLPSAPASRAKALEARGATISRVRADRDGGIDLRALAARLGAEKMTSALVEGGGEVHASFLAAQLADELRVYVAPIVVGGPARSWVGGAGIESLAKAHRLEWLGA